MFTHEHPKLESYAHHKMHVLPREVWNLEKCTKLANRIDTDGMGTPFSLRGHVTFQYPQVYNGGTIIDGEWFNGIYQDLPEIPEGFTFVHRSSWGWQLIKTPEPI